MKKFLSLFLLAAGITASAQNADPYLSLQTIPPTIPINTTSILEVTAGNAGNNSIAPNSLRMVVSVGTNAEILGLGAGDDRWSVVDLQPGTGNTMILTNTGGGFVQGFTAFNLGQFEIILKGTVVGGPSVISANIGYITANNPLIGGALNASQGNANTTNDNGTTSLQVVTGPLVVRLVDFNVSASGCTAQLAWSTSTEENFNRFEIQQSVNGRDFNNVSSIAGRGGASTGATYRFAYDQNSSKAYYRLKMIDSDGTVTYSKVASVSTRCNERSVVINPNPVFENQSVNITLAGYEGKVRGELFATSGQMMASYTLQNGVNTVQLSNLLSKGTYQLRVTGETGESQSYKLVIMK